MPAIESHENRLSCFFVVSALAGESPRKHCWPNGRQSVNGSPKPHYGECRNPRYGSGSDSAQSTPRTRLPLRNKQSGSAWEAGHRFPTTAKSYLCARLFLAWPPLPMGKTAEEPSRLLDGQNPQQPCARYSRIALSSPSRLAGSRGLAVSDSKFRQDLTARVEVLTYRTPVQTA